MSITERLDQASKDCEDLRINILFDEDFTCIDTYAEARHYFLMAMSMLEQARHALALTSLKVSQQIAARQVAK